MAAVFDPIQAVFQDVMRDFRAELDDEQVYRDILQTTTIDQVHDAAENIQKEQAKSGHLRHLSKISPYLDRLAEYATVVEIFVQAKPDVLALIWGPIKLLLQWTSALRTSYDAIVNTMAEIGELLPEFKRALTIFNQNSVLKDVMALFFRDLLDFYLVALRFFKLPRWKYLFESLWPRHRDRIKVVMGHVQNHARLMRIEVGLEHIQQEHEARRRALEHFEKDEKFRRTQEFHCIKTDIAPQSYDDKLDGLRARICQGTGHWLLQEEAYKKWLETAAEPPRTLWLQGIPGAGKTYLTSTVIDKVRSLGHTAFVFLSYKQDQRATAISVLHSFIFRLASGEEDLQTVVCQSCSEESKRSLQGAAALLTTVLSCTGPAYLIVDGLDEMDEEERGILLPQLLSIIKSSHEAKLFVSSRAEADLTSILRNEATAIRIDKRNSDCIQTFIQQWAQHWFIEREFWPEEQTQIKAGLAPLATKSKGMFLYARVVLNGIQFLDNFVDIREELNALPETLDDAYSRILKRINSLDRDTMRERARMILGWIACSPTPLTVQEIQQAWSIDPENPEYTSGIHGNLNLVRICGPIVEVIDDYVQFVHFTVKEYLFSSKISGFIDINRATLDLALRCITYLCQAHHDPALTDDQVYQNIRTGAYVLDWFATRMWPQLTRKYLRDTLTQQEAPRSELISHLERLHYKRLQNETLEDKDDDDDIDSLLPGLGDIKQTHPEIYGLVGQTIRFHRLCKASEARMSRGAPWIDLDPLGNSELSVRIHEAIECPPHQIRDNEGVHWATMQRWYGNRPHKCKYLYCQFNRVGFQHASEGKSHEKFHDRPWKCSIPGCEYAEGGFLSRKMRDDHLDRAHSNQNERTFDLGSTGDENETKLMLLDLIKAGLVDAVENMLSSHAEFTVKHADDMFRAAIESGSLSMVEFLAPKLGDSTLQTEATQLATRLNQAEIFQFLVCQYPHCRYLYPASWKNIISLGSCQMADSWIQAVAPMAYDEETRTRLHYYATASGRSVLIRTAANDRAKEKPLIQLWEFGKSLGAIKASDLGGFLIDVAKTTCSTNLAQFLLDSGVDVDSRRSPKYFTALRYATKQDTAEASALIKFLLLAGADPDIEQEFIASTTRRADFVTKMEDEKGARGISKWLGITWNELLKETEECRSKGKAEKKETRGLKRKRSAKDQEES
ncbi:NACHT domain protein [Durotheca rogersii]|uniref:NACHT domain protein n=1 Tax=Durotheca rogersii TaxID=419775 RepID=UPI0022201E7B|nr:NACHT domain protein [Durotheca rogersii]KAI5867325.1 NACHT domain protein [Durotheca rogersii]